MKNLLHHYILMALNISMMAAGCFIYSRDEILSLESSELFGYGFTDDALIVGSEGLTQYQFEKATNKFPTEGRFCGIFIERDNIIIRTDATGQEMIYIYQNLDDWVISNSFLLLAEYVSQSRELSIFPPAVIGFHLKDGKHIGEQLISHRTMIKEITLAPLTTELHVMKDSGKIFFQNESYLEKFKMPDDKTYPDTLLDVLERGAGLVAALQNAGYSMNLHLSGGYDSRLVLCMMLANGNNNGLRISSYVGKKDDYIVAKSICNRLNLPLNSKGPTRHKSMNSRDSYCMYLLSGGATYLPFYPVRHIISNPEIIITGDQPTGWSHFAGSAQFNGDADKISVDIFNALNDRGFGESVQSEFLSTFDVIGIDKQHPASMIAHYSAVRSRHHCGRNWYKCQGNKFLFTPLMQSIFIAMDLHNLERGYHPTKIFVDAFSAFGGWAIEEPFENERKFDPDLIEKSPFKGGVEIVPRQYKLYGNIQDISEADYSILYPKSVVINDEHTSIEGIMSELLENSSLARQSGFFMTRDFDKAASEILQKKSLSHGYRKSMHIISTNVVLKIIEKSKEKKRHRFFQRLLMFPLVLSMVILGYFLAV